MEVHIRSTPVNLKHRFIPVQLVYNKMTLKRKLMGSNTHKEGGNTPVIGQSFTKFLDCNSLVLDDVKNSYPDTHAELGNPNELLAVKTCTDTETVFGQVHETVGNVTTSVTLGT